MIKVRKYAAIDIGSNAMRLLISNIVEEKGKPPVFSKSSIVRVPIRLGQDVFTDGEITQESLERMVDAMTAFRLIMKVHKVEKYNAFATSAMREAFNSEEVVEVIREKSNIEIQVIGGKKEAMIIASTDLKNYLADNKTYLFVDVGGGSTELTLYKDGDVLHQKSFKIGTVRLLNNIVNESVWDHMQDWITNATKGIVGIELIGSGGNINKLHKMSGKRQDVPLSFDYVRTQYNYLNGLTYDERVSKLGLNSDRADVIVPATRIYFSAMKWAHAKKMYVPKIGLADGVIKAMYHGII